MSTCNRVIECKIAVESDHRIANHMAMLASYVRLRRCEFSMLPDANDGPEVLRLLDSIAAQVSAVSELHRMLTGIEASSSGDIGAQLGRICGAFRNGSAFGTVIEYSGGTGCILPVSHILPVSQIVSEVITNSLKYGHKAGCAGSIRVGCHRAEGGHIIISVVDDGDGMAPATAGGTKPISVGVAMVAALVRQVNGTVEYRSSDLGLSFSLSLSPGQSSPRGAGARCGPIRLCKLMTFSSVSTRGFARHLGTSAFGLAPSDDRAQGKFPVQVTFTLITMVALGLPVTSGAPS